MEARYKPIADYGLIGNLRTAALVGRDGSIDWYCSPNFSSPSQFAAILDADKGGLFRVTPRRGLLGTQHYQSDTNVLETVFHTDTGHLTVIDFMPLRGDIVGCGPSEAPPIIFRLLHCDEGALEVDLTWSPRFAYATVPVKMEGTPGGFVAVSEGQKVVLTGLPGRGEIVPAADGRPLGRSRFAMQAGERVVLASIANDGLDDARMTTGWEAAEGWLRSTVRTWRAWLHKESTANREWAGRHRDLVVRSELTLKLLTHADTGSIIAAPTTSLPEAVGAERNWDYRYAWIRDASLTIQALLAVGHFTEAVDFLHWVERVSMQGERNGAIQIMYGVHGETGLEENILEHLEGYRGSRPVRAGNEAYTQRQLDTYAELLASLYELARSGQEVKPVIWSFLCKAANRAAASLHEPDAGIWEMRGPPRHFVYSKATLWVALDRAVHLSEQFHLPGDRRRWAWGKEQVRNLILRYGYDEDVGSFVQYFGSKELDASNLRIPLQEFLPFDDARVCNTIDATLRHLTEDDLVYRYRADDGLSGEEGAFVLCTFWLVDCLALSGRLDEAYEIYEGLVSRVNHVGLLPEEIDPRSGLFLGNFPQAFSHIGFINSTLYLASAEGRSTPVVTPIGSASHRRKLGHR